MGKAVKTEDVPKKDEREDTRKREDAPGRYGRDSPDVKEKENMPKGLGRNGFPAPDPRLKTSLPGMRKCTRRWRPRRPGRAQSVLLPGTTGVKPTSTDVSLGGTISIHATG